MPDRLPSPLKADQADRSAGRRKGVLLSRQDNDVPSSPKAANDTPREGDTVVKDEVSKMLGLTVELPFQLHMPHEVQFKSKGPDGKTAQGSDVIRERLKGLPGKLNLDKRTSGKYFGTQARSQFFDRYHWLQQQHCITTLEPTSRLDRLYFENESGEQAEQIPFGPLRQHHHAHHVSSAVLNEKGTHMGSFMIRSGSNSCRSSFNSRFRSFDSDAASANEMMRLRESAARSGIGSADYDDDVENIDDDMDIMGRVPDGAVKSLPKSRRRKISLARLVGNENYEELKKVFASFDEDQLGSSDARELPLLQSEVPTPTFGRPPPLVRQHSRAPNPDAVYNKSPKSLKQVIAESAREREVKLKREREQRLAAIAAAERELESRNKVEVATASPAYVKSRESPLRGDSKLNDTARSSNRRGHFSRQRSRLSRQQSMKSAKSPASVRQKSISEQGQADVYSSLLLEHMLRKKNISASYDGSEDIDEDDEVDEHTQSSGFDSHSSEMLSHSTVSTLDLGFFLRELSQLAQSNGLVHRSLTEGSNGKWGVAMGGDSAERITASAEHDVLCRGIISSPRTKYLTGCMQNNVNPRASLLLRKNMSKELNLQHQGMGDTMAQLLAESIRGLPFIESINIADNMLTDDGMGPIILAVVDIPGLLQLNLSQNEIGPVSARALFEYLQSDSCPLERLILRSADVDDYECKKFIEAIKLNNSLRELDLSNNKIGAAENLNTVMPDIVTGGEAIADLLMSPACMISRLNLEWNMVRLEGAVELAKSLAVTQTLTYLDLSYNSLGTEGSLALGKSLLHNKSLQTLVVANNNIDSLGCFTIAAGIIENRGLSKLVLDGNPIGEKV